VGAGARRRGRVQHLHQDVSLRAGQYDYDAVPAIPPEIVLFPNWFYFNIYEISSWSRSILVPLAIIYAKKPFKKIRPSRASTSSS
jgi:squalene cyclase